VLDLKFISALDHPQMNFKSKKHTSHEGGSSVTGDLEIRSELAIVRRRISKSSR